MVRSFSVYNSSSGEMAWLSDLRCSIIVSRRIGARETRERIGAMSVDKRSFLFLPQVPRPWRKSRLAEWLFDLSSLQGAALGRSRGLSWRQRTTTGS